MSGTPPGAHRPYDSGFSDTLPPPYSLTDETARRANTFCADSRESSSQSLAPSTYGDEDTEGRRRRLLIVYIHGFYGNDQSFRSFPAHVHGYLKTALRETHVVHSKIYPRYKTYKSMDIAVENFSAWLQPHENPDTDVILVGHSMGGIVAAEVVLLLNKSPYSYHPLRHRILGTISMDCPFLGLHPGIIVSGISSLFRSSPEPPAANGESPSGALSPATTATTVDSPQLSQVNSTTSGIGAGHNSVLSSSTSLTSPPPTPDTDPHFNQPFFNDKSFKERPFKQRLIHFVKKHSSEGVFYAAKNHVLSHLEYGGCLADYAGLHNRYNRLRALEDVDELKALQEPQGPSSHNKPPARVRFINYYTISTGIPKKSKTPSPQATPLALASEELESMKNIEPLPEPLDPESTPGILVDPPGEGKKKEILAPGEDGLPEEASTPFSEPGVLGQKNGASSLNAESDDGPAKEQSAVAQQNLDLPSIPDPPVKPTPPDLDRYTDDDARNQAEKEAKRELKIYEKAVKNREKTLKERQKLIEKQQKKAEKERTKKEKEAEKLSAKQAKETPTQTTQPPSIVSTPSASVPDTDAQRIPDVQQPEPSTQTPPPLPPRAASNSDLPAGVQEDLAEAKKPAKERKFCVVPRKPDDTWVSVFMEGVDEVGAHCGLFMEEAPHYHGLVGDMGERILEWVQENLTKEAIIQMTRDAGEIELD